MKTKPSWYSPLRLAQLATISFAIVYAALLAFLYVAQDDLIYPRAMSGTVLAPELASREAAAAGLVPWDRAAPGSLSPQGYVPRDFTAPASRGTIVVFHGNGGWAGQRTLYPDAFARRGFRTFLYEYPGYGGRPGSPREIPMVADARALIRALDAAGLGPIYVWGESLGSGVAAAVVADPTLPVRGLTLMMPWDSLAHEALFCFPFVPVGLLLHDRYDSLANLRAFPHPICVVRGDRDATIPPRLTLNLFAHLPDPKLMILQSGYGHGDWPSEPNLAWWDEALDFIAPGKR